MAGLLLGCIADDLTGATDLANTLVRRGMRTALAIGVPDRAEAPEGVDAMVVALKSRTIEPDLAVAQAMAALGYLRRAGAGQIVFKICSTFDSTDRGNIGPVADALRAGLGAGFAVVCPAFPENGRTVYQGHLFVGDRLLSESSMRDHPLTPMTDADLVRVLGRQTRGKVGLVPCVDVRRGPGAIAAALGRLRAGGWAYAIVDALEDGHLIDIGAACADQALLVGGSGIALGLPDNFRRAGRLGGDAADALPDVAGHEAIIAGSCSAATLGQIAAFARDHAAIRLDTAALARDGQVAATTAAATTARLAAARLADGPVLVYASAPSAEVARTQAALGRDQAGVLIEHALAEVAAGLVAAGVRRLVVAGGETAGAVVRRLGIATLLIGPQIDPGVPWTASMAEPRLLLALKSGNFGSPDFFAKAFRMLRCR
ncbi:MAG: 3-oxo-tetronate kinase [Alphaproteobacteria bacterium]